jgi:PAS domain-containing protein
VTSIPVPPARAVADGDLGPAGAPLGAPASATSAAARRADRATDPVGFGDALFVQAPLAVALYDGAGRVAAGNAAYEQHFGVRVADVPPDYSILTDPQLEAAGLLPLVRQAYAGDAVALPPVRYDAAAASHGVGRTVWTQAHCFPVRDAAGEVAYVAVVHVDGRPVGRGTRRRARDAATWTTATRRSSRMARRVPRRHDMRSSAGGWRSR